MFTADSLDLAISSHWATRLQGNNRSVPLRITVSEQIISLEQLHLDFAQGLFRQYAMQMILFV